VGIVIVDINSHPGYLIQQRDEAEAVRSYWALAPFKLVSGRAHRYEI